MKYEKLEVGQVLFSIERCRMGNTCVKTVIVYTAKIMELLPDRRGAMVSWNSNSPTFWGEKSLAKLKKDKPVLIKGSFGNCRLATREEIKKMKEG